MSTGASIAFLCLLPALVLGSEYEFIEYINKTDPASLQIYEFKLEHSKPIGIITTSSGKIVEIRETKTLNSDPFANQYFVDFLSHSNAEKIPERFVHSKGGGAFGYFEVTNDVSKYTKAEVFNGVGKKTPVVFRGSLVSQNLGGNDLARETKGFAIKFYTREGNLDLLCLNFPVFFLKDPIDFPNFIHAVKRNPKTGLFDFNTLWDFFSKTPVSLHAVLWLMSDFGIPNGYRHMDAFGIHTYEINNKHGDRYFVKFNFRTEQGIENLPSNEAEKIGGRDPDYFNRDLYNAIEKKKYPTWLLEMDVLSYKDIKNLDYNPFELTRLWKNGTYCTIPIGRLVLNRNPDNFFRVVEQSGYQPGNLVPGIPGPHDVLFKARRKAYRDTQVYRLGVNHNRISVNTPLYYKGYDRDGQPPLRDNMKDAPNYYPNSFNGPVPYVDPSQPKEKFLIYDSNAVDLEQPANFYNKILRTDDERARLVNNIVSTLLRVIPETQKRLISLLSLIEPKFGNSVKKTLVKALQKKSTPRPKVLKYQRSLTNKDQCHIKRSARNEKNNISPSLTVS